MAVLAGVHHHTSAMTASTATRPAACTKEEDSLRLGAADEGLLCPDEGSRGPAPDSNLCSQGHAAGPRAQYLCSTIVSRRISHEKIFIYSCHRNSPDSAGRAGKIPWLCPAGLLVCLGHQWDSRSWRGS